MCCKGVRQNKKKATKAFASEMSRTGCCGELSRTIGRKRSAVSTPCLQTENGIRVKFSLPDADSSGPGRILRRRPDEEEFCVTPVKASPAKDESLAGRHMGSLPFDLLVQVVCKLHHHELEPVSCVSGEFRKAVEIAREIHFDYKTPDRMRRPIRSLFINKSSANSASRGDSPSGWPATPNAPKHEWKARKIHLTSEYLTELSAELFPEGKKSSSIDVIDVGDAEHTISLRPGIATNRVLFSENELSGALPHHCI
uniref:F-box domain-containing protein n=1 Tax=Picea sitchensis TaxID=3332 RepID=A9NRS1_PICSI|nr:unknown [Picea sitchensis]